jgi:hypothetical protein
MLPVGFETTMPVFERAKAVYALDRAATVIGPLRSLCNLIPITVLATDPEVPGSIPGATRFSEK